MSRYRNSTACPNSRETVWGGLYFAFQLFLLPQLLQLGNAALGSPLSAGELNFTFFLINFLAVLFLFHDFLGKSASQILRHPGLFCEGVILGYVAYSACTIVIDWLIGQLAPGFSNANDASIAAMGRQNGYLVFIGTVILVPPVEECLFRGVIFRNLYSKSPWAAYLVSMLAFALIHIAGFLGSYSPVDILLCMLQYLPAGLCLAWSYIRGETIFAPIVIHALVNAVGIYRLR